MGELKHLFPEAKEINDNMANKQDIVELKAELNKNIEKRILVQQKEILNALDRIEAKIDKHNVQIILD